jgi:hypothetical protein
MMRVSLWLPVAILSLGLLSLAEARGETPHEHGAGHAHAGNSAAKNLVRSAHDGAWSAGKTWEGGKVPQAGDAVQIRTGHRVVYDVKSTAVLRAVHIAGTLQFAADKDTQLEAGLIKVQAGDSVDESGFDCEAVLEEPAPGQTRATLLVGTPDEPIAAAHTALIRLHYIEGMDKLSCPALVCCGGRMEIHGAPLSRAWVKLGATATKGATEITLAEPVTGWRVGDRVVLTSTDTSYHDDGQSEVHTIAALDGTTLKLDSPLGFEHLGDGEFRGEVANLSRNVVVESATPDGERGHTMYHRHSAGSLGYAEFRHLGKKNVLGRYSLHFHLAGNTMRGSYVEGVSVWDSHNRWLTIHGTNYLVVRDNVGFGSVGHGFFLEDGTEVYNVLDRNLAIGARSGKRLPKQVLPFDQNQGAGFWWANSLNTFTRNVAADNDQYGFRFEATPTSAMKTLALPILQPDGSEKAIDIRTLPFVRFDDNEVHSSHGLYGINLGEGVRGVGPDVRHPFVVRNTKIWNSHYGMRPQVPSLLVENLTIKTDYGIYHPNFVNHVYRNVVIQETNTEPFNRGHDDDSLQHGVLTVENLTFDGIRSGGMPLIQISDHNATGEAASHFRGLKTVNWNDKSRGKAIVNRGGGPRPEPKTSTGVPVYVYDWFGPGRHALVVSTHSPEYKQDPGRYHEEPPLTGNDSRVVEVTDVDFPQLLSPIDDLPPTTVITRVEKLADGRVRISGAAADNGDIKQVLVNGQAAAELAPNFAQWQVTLDAKAAAKIIAHATDGAGNVEQLAHEVAGL